MISREVSFKDAENGFEVKVFVETPVEYEEYDRGSKKYYQSLYLCLDAGRHGGTTTWAHIPREQAKEIIEAMKAVLNEK